MKGGPTGPPFIYKVDLIRLLIAISAALVFYLVGAAAVRYFNQPPPPEPALRDVQPVDYKFRCEVCGVEVTMTAAPAAEVPDAPRHCREDMTLVAEAGSW
mgnify:CR=1 FL=1